MNGDANGAGMFGNITADGLPNPPGGVSAEFESTRGVEFGNRA